MQSLPDAAKKLSRLAGNQSPLLALLALASQNTAVDDPAVAGVFQPVQAVVPAGSAGRAPKSELHERPAYAPILARSARRTAGRSERCRGYQALANAANAKVVTRQIAQVFRPDPDGHVDSTLQGLMEAPITAAEGLLRVLGPAELNAKGKGALHSDPRSLEQVSLQ